MPLAAPNILQDIYQIWRGIPYHPFVMKIITKHPVNGDVLKNDQYTIMIKDIVNTIVLQLWTVKIIGM